MSAHQALKPILEFSRQNGCFRRDGRLVRRSRRPWRPGRRRSRYRRRRRRTEAPRGHAGQGFHSEKTHQGSSHQRTSLPRSVSPWQKVSWNRTALIRHLCRKIAIFSCHRCLILCSVLDEHFIYIPSGTVKANGRELKSCLGQVLFSPLATLKSVQVYRHTWYFIE